MCYSSLLRIQYYESHSQATNDLGNYINCLEVKRSNNVC